MVLYEKDDLDPDVNILVVTTSTGMRLSHSNQTAESKACTTAKLAQMAGSLGEKIR